MIQTLMIGYRSNPCREPRFSPEFIDPLLHLDKYLLTNILNLISVNYNATYDVGNQFLLISHDVSERMSVSFFDLINEIAFLHIWMYDTTADAKVAKMDQLFFWKKISFSETFSELVVSNEQLTNKNQLLCNPKLLLYLHCSMASIW